MTNLYKLSTLQEWKINRNVQNSNGSFNGWIFVLLVVNVQRSKPFHLCLIEKLSKIPLHKTSAAKWGWLISQRVNFIFDQPEFGGILSNVFESPPPPTPDTPTNGVSVCWSIDLRIEVTRTGPRNAYNTKQTFLSRDTRLDHIKKPLWT